VPDSETIVITSVRNQRVVEARKLRQRKHRRRQRRFLVEDSTLLTIALDAGAQPFEVFYCENQLEGREALTLMKRFREFGAELVAVSPRVMETLSERDISQGMVASFASFEASLQELPLVGCKLVLVMDRLQDPGNLGTLIRTADAVGAAATILIEPCVDPFDTKTVRGTMGSLFNVPLVRTADVSGLFSFLREKGLRLIGSDACRGKAGDEALWKGGVALVLGNEARGLSDDVRPLMEAWVCLPLVGKAESLNVAVAGGVMMYDWLRANLGEKNSGQQSACGAKHQVSQDNQQGRAGQ
jgi:TrmH family RNA methyltransferase